MEGEVLLLHLCIFVYNQQYMSMSIIKNGEQADCDGSSFEKAIVAESVDAEYAWLAENYPGYIMQMQGLREDNGKAYDVLSIQTAEGAEKEVYFDISGFFGGY